MIICLRIKKNLNLIQINSRFSEKIIQNHVLNFNLY